MAEIWTIGKILKWTEEYFQKYNIENPRLDAEVLLGYVLNKERIFLYVHFDQPLDSEELAKFKECIKRNKYSFLSFGIKSIIVVNTVIPN